MQLFEEIEAGVDLRYRFHPIESPDSSKKQTIRRHEYVIKLEDNIGDMTIITFVPTKHERAHSTATSQRLLLSKPPTEAARCNSSVNFRPRTIESWASMLLTSVPCKFSLETLVLSHLLVPRDQGLDMLKLS